MTEDRRTFPARLSEALLALMLRALLAPLVGLSVMMFSHGIPPLRIPYRITVERI